MRSLSESLVNRTHSVFGVRLRPFSLAHVEALRIIDHPALTTGVMSWTDLEVFCAVCRTRDPLEDLAGTLQKRPWQLRVLKPLSPFFWARANDIIDCYIRDFFSVPKLWKENKKHNRQQKYPWTIEAVHTLTSEWGMTYAEAWRCPVGLALHAQIVSAESKGADVPVITDEDEKQIAALGGAAT